MAWEEKLVSRIVWALIAFGLILIGAGVVSGMSGHKGLAQVFIGSALAEAIIGLGGIAVALVRRRRKRG